MDLESLGSDIGFTEVKMETAIDRVSGAAKHGSLRQIERVPAGARFSFEILFTIFEEEDKDLLKNVFVALELLEDDYLGGMGSRGYGQVKFSDLKIFWNSRKDYESGNIETAEKSTINNSHNTPVDVVKNFETIKKKIT